MASPENAFGDHLLMLSPAAQVLDEEAKVFTERVWRSLLEKSMLASAGL